MLFTTKYAPRNLSEIKGQDLAISQLKNYVVNYRQQKQKAILLWGPIGVGKTSSVYALAKELDYDLLELNSSDLRNQDEIKKFLDSALGQRSLFFKSKMVLIDEVDNISGVKDRGCIPALLKGIEKSQYPVILTANDPFDQKFKALKKTCLVVEYPKLNYAVVAEVLKDVCLKEGIKYEDKGLSSLARRSDGDVRAALLDLQICGYLTLENVGLLTDRKRTDSILQALAVIFKSSSVDNALAAIDDVDTDMDEIMFWMDHNLPKEYLDAVSLSRAYEHLSRVDVFNGRIKKRQHWRFLVYMNNLLTAGISSAKAVKNKEFVKYMPTMRILRMWQAKMKNAHRKEIASKLASFSHMSTKKALEQIPYLQEMFRAKDCSELAAELDLSDEEVEWLRRLAVKI